MGRSTLRDRVTGGRQDDPPPDQPGAEVAVAEDHATADAAAFDLLTSWSEQIGQVLASGQELDHFIRLCAINMVNSKSAAQLAKCNLPSLYNAVAQCAHYGLPPDGTHAAIVPFGEVATFIPMYQGFVQLAFNTGQVASVTAKLIYARDDWGEGYGTGPAAGGFWHKPARFAPDPDTGRMAPVLRGKLDRNFQPVPGPGEDNPPILAYCYGTFRDGTHTEVEVISIQEAIEVRDRFSKAYQNAERSWYGKDPKRDSFWHTDPDKAMLKTAVRRGMKYIPKSATNLLAELILADQASDSTIPGTPQPWRPPELPDFNGGPAAAWPGDVNHGNGTVIAGHAEPPEPEPDDPGVRDRGEATGGSTSTAGGAQPPQEPADPRPPAADQVRARARRNTDIQRLNKLLAEIGLAGRDWAVPRLLIIGAAASGDEPALDLKSPAQLNAEQAARAVSIIGKAIAGCHERGEAPRPVLLRVAQAQGWRGDEPGEASNGNA